jgi:hypothetical protein
MPKFISRTLVSPVTRVLVALLLVFVAPLDASQLAKLVGVQKTYTVDYLVVAGGGGGGANITGSGQLGAGGGGAGGFLTGSMTIISGISVPIVVGAGGIIGANGANSTAIGILATTVVGGGHGASYVALGATGGSGGGNGGDSNSAGAAGTPGQGNASGTTDAVSNSGSGGGGAGSAGVQGGPGLGLSNSLSGSAVTYAVGGFPNVGGLQTTPGSGGQGGNGDSSVSTDGLDGIVIIRYVGPRRATGGSYVFSGGFSIHTFTTNGTFVS